MTWCHVVLSILDGNRQVAGTVLLTVLITLQVIVHIEIIIVPLDGEDVIVASDGSQGFKLILRELLTLLLVMLVRGIGTIVKGSAEVTVLPSGILTGDGIEMAHLHNVYLATAGPTVLIDVVTHHPVSRPQTIGGIGELNLCLHYTMLEGGLLIGIDTTRRKTLALIVLALGGQHQITVSHTDVLLTVVLQLLVATT